MASGLFGFRRWKLYDSSRWHCCLWVLSSFFRRRNWEKNGRCGTILLSPLDFRVFLFLWRVPSCRFKKKEKNLGEYLIPRNCSPKNRFVKSVPTRRFRSVVCVLFVSLSLSFVFQTNICTHIIAMVFFFVCSPAAAAACSLFFSLVDFFPFSVFLSREWENPTTPLPMPKWNFDFDLFTSVPSQLVLVDPMGGRWG